MLDVHDDLHDMLYVYDKLNAIKVVEDAQSAFPLSGAYYNSSMRCLIFPTMGREVLTWFEESKRINMTPKSDFEGAHFVEPLLIPDHQFENNLSLIYQLRLMCADSVQIVGEGHQSIHAFKSLNVMLKMAGLVTVNVIGNTPFYILVRFMHLQRRYSTR